MEYKVIIGYDQVNVYVLNNRLKKRIAKKGYELIFDLRDRVLNLVNYSGLPYPPITVIPESRIVAHEDGVNAIVYANINYRFSGGYLHPLIEVYLPFLLYAPGEIKSLVLGHEFLHYIYLAIRYVSSDYLINPLIYTGDLTGRELLEELYTVNPNKIFNNRRFNSRLRKLKELLDSKKVADTIRKRWIDRNLPNKVIPADEFRIKLSMNMWANMYFPEDILRKARRISQSEF